MKTKDKIFKLLNKHPHLRDSDNKLIATCWYDEINNKGMNINDMSAMEFLHLFADHKITNPETIRRNRCKLQELNRELRGNKYDKRKGILQKEWRKELGYEAH
jgi:hypothetical protein